MLKGTAVLGDTRLPPPAHLHAAANGHSQAEVHFVLGGNKHSCRSRGRHVAATGVFQLVGQSLWQCGSVKAHTQSNKGQG